jgi:hypothetical protein
MNWTPQPRGIVLLIALAVLTAVIGSLMPSAPPTAADLNRRYEQAERMKPARNPGISEISPAPGISRADDDASTDFAVGRGGNDEQGLYIACVSVQRSMDAKRRALQGR